MDSNKKNQKKKEQIKKVKTAMGRVILPPNKVEETKLKYSRKKKHRKDLKEELND